MTLKVLSYSGAVQIISRNTHLQQICIEKIGEKKHLSKTVCVLLEYYTNIRTESLNQQSLQTFQDKDKC